MKIRPSDVVVPVFKQLKMRTQEMNVRCIVIEYVFSYFPICQLSKHIVDKIL